MGYHPETLVFTFPGHKGWLRRLSPVIGFDVWHIDPEKPGTGNRQDDSCGWFDRTPGEYAEAVEYLLHDATLLHEVNLILARRVETLAPSMLPHNPTTRSLPMPYRPRRGQTSFDATIAGGLPVYVEATIHPPEPDVGIFHEQVEITGIYWPRRTAKGKWRPIPSSLDARIDLEDLERQALESAE